MTNATSGPVARRLTTVNGKNAGVVEANAVMGVNPQPWLLIDDVQTRLNAMNAQAIDIEALSINPFWYAADPDVSARVISIQNEKLAEWVASEPERFVGLASVALQHPDQ